MFNGKFEPHEHEVTKATPPTHAGKILTSVAAAAARRRLTAGGVDVTKTPATAARITRFSATNMYFAVIALQVLHQAIPIHAHASA